MLLIHITWEHGAAVCRVFLSVFHEFAYNSSTCGKYLDQDPATSDTSEADSDTREGETVAMNYKPSPLQVKIGHMQHFMHEPCRKAGSARCTEVMQLFCAMNCISGTLFLYHVVWNVSP
ncbi:uncharacterized protein LOC118378220 isoform X1 [Oncorhynchus keta]|uniref:uncharacterized protein LOC118378220 isoform X1 n=1 Tax=Oncorhynchus keta TaxID=8018 RepID=UPI00227B29BE|nr:uncharacterized protein LOC118378220 isoform X1 [Oncorhynchus keta]